MDNAKARVKRAAKTVLEPEVVDETAVAIRPESSPDQPASPPPLNYLGRQDIILDSIYKLIHDPNNWTPEGLLKPEADQILKRINDQVHNIGTTELLLSKTHLWLQIHGMARHEARRRQEQIIGDPAVKTFKIIISGREDDLLPDD